MTNTNTYLCVLRIVTLEDALASGVSGRLSAACLWKCANGFVKATKALHQIGILYLRWKGIRVFI